MTTRNIWLYTAACGTAAIGFWNLYLWHQSPQRALNISYFNFADRDKLLSNYATELFNTSGKDGSINTLKSKGFDCKAYAFPKRTTCKFRYGFVGLPCEWTIGFNEFTIHGTTIHPSDKIKIRTLRGCK